MAELRLVFVDGKIPKILDKKCYYFLVIHTCYGDISKNVPDSSDIEFGYTVAEHLTIVGELKIIRLKNH